MKDRDEIKELFSEKLGNYEAKVNPNLWNSISSQIGATAVTSAASTGISLLTKWVIGISVASVVAITAVIVTSETEKTPSKEISKTKEVTNLEPSSSSVNKQKEEKSPQAVPSEVITEPIPLNTIKKEESDVLITENIALADLVEKEIKTSDAPIVDNSKTPVLVEKEKVIKLPEVIEPETKENKVVDEGVVVGNVTPEIPETTYKIGELHNIFTPNGDGNNDLFFIESEGLVEFNIVVLDAQSKVVFQSNNPDFKWDGNDLSGAAVPAGVGVKYIYYITARDKNGNPVNKANMLKIIR